MTDTEITHLEQELKVSLPASYRTFLSSYPADLALAVGDFELIAEADRLLTMNRELRSKPFYRFPPWPNHLFAIGENGCGDYYFLDLKDRSGAVRFVDHEKLNDERLAANVQAWIPKLLAEKKDEEKA